MNLKEIQDRLLEISAEVLTLHNQMALALGNVTESNTYSAGLADLQQEIKAGDTVMCVDKSEAGEGTVGYRCFTLGKHYKVAEVFDVSRLGRVIQVEADDEGDKHLTSSVKFSKMVYI